MKTWATREGRVPKIHNQPLLLFSRLRNAGRHRQHGLFAQALWLRHIFPIIRRFQDDPRWGKVEEDEKKWDLFLPYRWKFEEAWNIFHQTKKQKNDENFKGIRAKNFHVESTSSNYHDILTPLFRANLNMNFAFHFQQVNFYDNCKCLA